jgi:hypothetical protein
MNRKYGKLTKGQIEYAPDALAVDGGIKVNPSEASYLAAGWKKVADVRPAPDEGMDVMLSSWTDIGDAITAVYKQVPHANQEVPSGEGGGEPVTPPEKGKRVFSKLKLVAALKAADKWVLVKTWLEEKSYYDYYLAAQDFAEDYQLFAEGREAIKGYLGITDEEIERLLEKCVAD